MITPTRWGHRWKILPRTPPEILRRIFWCNKNFWEKIFQHPIKPEVDRKWRHITLRSAILIMKNTYMLRFEFLCDSYRCYKGHVSKLTEKSSYIDSNKSASVKYVLHKWTVVLHYEPLNIVQGTYSLMRVKMVLVHICSPESGVDEISLDTYSMTTRLIFLKIIVSVSKLQ